MKKYDVIIIGGGPAGSTCARALVQKGFNTALLDRCEFPRQKLCAGWITPQVLKLLDLDASAYSAENVLQSLTAFKVGLLGGTQHTLNYGTVVSYGIRRTEFDNYLLQRCGADLYLGQRAKLRYSNGTWTVNERFQAPLLVGAGGHFCPVAKYVKKAGTKEHAVVSQEVEFELSPQQLDACTVSGEAPELFFCRDLAGYGWIFRKGNWLNIGIGRQSSPDIKQYMKSFVSQLRELRKIPEKIPPAQGHAYLLYSHSERSLSGEGYLLVGDAAGLSCDKSGEGIRPAVQSALAAAETVVGADGNYSADRLHSYNEKLVALLGRRTPPTKLPPALIHMLSPLLLSSSWFNRQILLDRWFFGQ